MKRGVRLVRLLEQQCVRVHMREGGFARVGGHVAPMRQQQRREDRRAVDTRRSGGMSARGRMRAAEDGRGSHSGRRRGGGVAVLRDRVEGNVLRWKYDASNLLCAAIPTAAAAIRLCGHADTVVAAVGDGGHGGGGEKWCSSGRSGRGGSGGGLCGGRRARHRCEVTQSGALAKSSFASARWCVDGWLLDAVQICWLCAEADGCTRTAVWAVKSQWGVRVQRCAGLRSVSSGLLWLEWRCLLGAMNPARKRKASQVMRVDALQARQAAWTS